MNRRGIQLPVHKCLLLAYTDGKLGRTFHVICATKLQITFSSLFFSTFHIQNFIATRVINSKQMHVPPFNIILSVFPFYLDLLDFDPPLSSMKHL